MQSLGPRLARPLAGSILLLALLAGCSKKGSSAALYSALAASDLAIGVHFEMPRAEVEAVLGAPDQTKEKQRGLYVEAYYITRTPEDDPALPPPIPDLLGPQLKLTYVDGKLAQVYNAYQVDQEKPLLPPKVVEPLAGLKVGSRRSDLHKLLGKPLRSGADQDEWRFEGEATIVDVQLKFLHVDEAQADLAAALTISSKASTTESRGEQFEKNKKARDSMHGQ